jgi:redox-sensitive bicupin YhaK (pirin superfamily)
MKYIIHKANERGHANHGWLNAYHSFSFASWYNPEKIQFGMLRVLNDDTIAAGMGFGTHPKIVWEMLLL